MLPFKKNCICAGKMFASKKGTLSLHCIWCNNNSWLFHCNLQRDTFHLIYTKRAYDILRANKNFSLKSKKVFLKAISHINSNNNTSNFSIECGKGFYVRSLARDMAQKLMTFGHVIELKRTKVGNFTEKSTILLQNREIFACGAWKAVFRHIISHLS